MAIEIEKYGKKTSRGSNELNNDQVFSDQSRKVRLFIFASLIVHAVVIASLKLDLFEHKTKEPTEWVIETDIHFDTNVLPPSEKSALPNAKESEKTTVTKKLLPQLPKVVSPKAEEKVEAEKKEEEPDLKKGEAEEPKEPEKKEEKKETEDNKIEDLELKKRLALELLRKNKQFDKERQAQKADAIAKLKQQSEKTSNLNANVSQVALAKYFQIVKTEIKKCYTIPDTYKFKKAGMVLSVQFYIDNKGEVNDLQIENSSGDEVLDAIIIDGVHRCSPYPEPPRREPTERAIFNFKIN